MRYAISDIHGCSKTLRAALKDIDLQPDDELFLLGDYINRGPDSLGVLETIWNLQADGYRVNCLRGNHEEMFIDAHAGNTDHYDWSPGGDTAKRAYDWFIGLPHYHLTPGYILVHAGLDFRSPDPLASKDAMLWSRYWQHLIDYSWLGERIIVHGHTPIEKDKIEELERRLPELQWIDIDAGCYNEPGGYGFLSVLNLDNRSVTFFNCIDTVRW